MIERIVRGSVAHARLVVAATVFLAIGCALIARNVTLDALPDLTSNQVLVLTSAPGYSPEEVELRVTTPIELALAGAPGLIEQRSISRYGITAVTAVFSDDVPALVARQQISERLLSAREALPADVGDPELAPLSGGLGEIVHFVLASDTHSVLELSEIARYRVSPLLRRVSGVVEVNSWGGAERTFDVFVDPARLAEKRLTLGEVSRAIEASVGVAAGGSVGNGNAQFVLRGLARPTTSDEIASLRIPTERGAVRLAEIARVETSMRPRLGAASLGGEREVVYVMAQMLRDENALEVVGRIHDALPAIEQSLPEGVRLVPVYDRSDLVLATLRTVAKNLLEGGVLVVLVLLLALGSIRAGLVVAAVIPLSMLGAGAGMTLFGIPGNLMSLGALDFGLIVDGAVVMVEHVFHEHLVAPRREDESLEDWLARTAASVARPTLFAMLTISLVYVPVVSLSGVDGKMFRPMALVVLLALGTALALSLTFVPAALAVFVRDKMPENKPLFARILDRAYAPVLRLTRVRIPIFGAALALLVLGGALGSRLGSELAPTLDEGDLVIQTTRAPDIRLSGAIDDGQRLERAVRRVPEVVQVASRIGNPAIATDIMGLEQADVFVRLRPRAEWPAGRTREDVIASIEAAIREDDSDVELSFTQPIQMRFNELLGGSVTDVSVSVYGPDLGEIRRLADAVAASLEGVPGAVDTRVLAPADVQVLNVAPDTLRASAYGLATADVLDVVRSAQVGIEAGATAIGPQSIPIVVKQPGVEGYGAVGLALAPTPEGGLATLSQLASVESVLSPGLVQHRDGERRFMVGFNVRGADLATVVEAARRKVASSISVPRGMRLEWGGQIETLEDARARLLVVIPIVAVLILALMLSVFREAKPVILLATHVPFACIGGIAGLVVRDLSFSVSAAIGFIALSGIAVMNGMVLLVRARGLRAKPAEEAIAEAASDRARPVLMTALVAALGFVPMMFATGIGSEVQRPLATVVVCGLLTSTFTTLFLMPAIYPLLFRKER